MADGPAAGLAQVDAVEAELDGYPLLPATRADLLRRAGDSAAAVTQYRAALAAAGNDGERRYLARRLAELGWTAAPPPHGKNGDHQPRSAPGTA